MRMCPSCKLSKNDFDFPNAPLGLNKRYTEEYVCRWCVYEKNWFSKYPNGKPCVYLVEGAGLYKIGVTKDLAKRLPALRSMSPVPLTLEFAWDGDEQIENAFHRTYRKKRHHGEWFALEPKQVAEIKLRPVPIVKIGEPKKSRYGPVLIK